MSARGREIRCLRNYIVFSASPYVFGAALFDGDVYFAKFSNRTSSRPRYLVRLLVKPRAQVSYHTLYLLNGKRYCNENWSIVYVIHEEHFGSIKISKFPPNFKLEFSRQNPEHEIRRARLSQNAKYDV
jgi:hypothetical protein